MLLPGWVRLPPAPSPPARPPAGCPPGWPVAACPSCVTIGCTGARHSRDRSGGLILSLCGYRALREWCAALWGSPCAANPCAGPSWEGGSSLVVGARRVRPVFAAALRPRSSPPSVQASPGGASLLREDDLAVPAPPLPLLLASPRRRVPGESSIFPVDSASQLPAIEQISSSSLLTFAQRL